MCFWEEASGSGEVASSLPRKDGHVSHRADWSTGSSAELSERPGPSGVEGGMKPRQETVCRVRLRSLPIKPVGMSGLSTIIGITLGEFLEA